MGSSEKWLYAEFQARDFINFRADYVVIATHQVVKKARLGGKEHSRARRRASLLH
jgi:hypothetical protein